MTDDIEPAEALPSAKVQELTASLAFVQLGDWWLSLVKESDETLEELAQFLRVPCGDEVHDRRADDGIVCIERELLGRLVRRVWVGCAREQPAPKPSWLVPWAELSEADREVDRRIGYACKFYVEKARDRAVRKVALDEAIKAVSGIKTLDLDRRYAKGEAYIQDAALSAIRALSDRDEAEDGC